MVTCGAALVTIVVLHVVAHADAVVVKITEFAALQLIVFLLPVTLFSSFICAAMALCRIALFTGHGVTG